MHITSNEKITGVSIWNFMQKSVLLQSSTEAISLLLPILHHSILHRNAITYC